MLFLLVILFTGDGGDQVLSVACAVSSLSMAYCLIVENPDPTDCETQTQNIVQLAKMCIEILQQNEEHHAEVRQPQLV